MREALYDDPCREAVGQGFLLWPFCVEYEEGKTAESRFIRDMDKFECMVQAYEYEQRTFGEKDLEEFQGLSSKIRMRCLAITQRLKAISKELHHNEYIWSILVGLSVSCRSRFSVGLR